MLESLFNKVAELQTCNIIKKRLQHRCFCVNIAKFLKTPILKIICERLLLPLEVFCKDFVHISYENASRLYLAAAYLFLNCNCILGYETSFSDRWGQPVLAKDSTLCFCSIYRSDQPLWKINGIA